MKIGIEAQRIFRKKKHGMDMVALELVRHLGMFDQSNQYVVFVKDDEDKTCLESFKNIELVVLPSAPYPIWEQVLLPLAARKHGVQLLHCTSNTAPLFPGVPLLITLHDIIYLEKMNMKEGTSYQRFGNLYRRWNVPIVAAKAKRLITVSEFERNRILQHFKFPDQKVVAVYNGVADHFKRVEDLAQLQEIKKKYALPDQYIFFLGNTDPKKNVKGVLKAISILKAKQLLPCKLLMLDINRDYLQRIAEEIGDVDVLNHIQFTGYITNKELPAIYSQATLFLYPSLRESFGIPMIEAMCCGVPVITSTTSCMPEVAGDAALLVDPTNAEEIDNAILKLMNDDDLRRTFIEKGYARAKHFSWKENALKTADIYHNILNN